MTDKASSTCSLKEDEVHARTHTVPGVNGIVLDAALAELSYGDYPCRLTIEKVMQDGQFHFEITLKKL